MRASRRTTWLSIALLAALHGCAADPGVSGGDGGGADGGVTGDGGGTSGRDAGEAGFEGLGDPCTTGADCPSGLCADRGGRSVCTARCEGSCPEGWSCRIVDVDGELVSLCAPVVPRACTPCTDDEQCPGGACLALDGERFCVPYCFEGSCAESFECLPDPAGVAPGLFCLPESGSCTCTDELAGTRRTCSVENDVGTCFGTQLCEVGTGWGPCDARTASDELCDGLDNDCNALIDDGVDGDPCDNSVDGVGTCAGVTLCLGPAGLSCQGPTPMSETCNYLDDDCDGTTDEGFGGLGDVCSAGIGACLRYGVLGCTADRAGTECSATPGAPVTELCNGRDDDCDGTTDEDFTDLGAACTVGAGICARIGARVCADDGLGTRCFATPGAPETDVCNGLDDDCNGIVDDMFRDASSGLYTADTACGSCGVDCTVLYGLPNAFGTCEVMAGAAGCRFNCTPRAFDLNGALSDGCEFLLEDVIYVSASDPAASDAGACGLGPVGTGPSHYPCATIARGLARAAATSRTRVLVANAIYEEAVTIANGVDLLGGYRWDTWERDVTATNTQLRGYVGLGAHRATVVANGISSATLFEGFVVRGAINAAPGGNSYGIYVSGSSAGLTIRSSYVYGGRGGPGAAGTPGGNGGNGANGTGRGSGATDAAYDAHIASGTGACNAASNNRQIENGAAGTCGGADVGGGRGGGNRCSPTEGVQFSAISGATGRTASGGGAGGAGSAGGTDARLYPVPPMYVLCSHPQNAEDGADGQRGSNGVAGAGCASVGGSVSGGHWVGASGSPATAGRAGGGGGGGGAGGGARCDGCTGGKDRIGAHGGGGGAGGCGGDAGGGAGAGGGAFGVFVAGAAPTITNTVVVRGEGGVGGNGGAGGVGGTGGTGASGGTSNEFCGGRAGRGGNGGDGGDAGGGGGGCGGASYGIAAVGAAGAAYCAPATGNTIAGGVGGNGGPGGFSLVAPGSAGANGALGDCVGF